MSGWASREAFKAEVLKWAEKLDVEVKGLYIRPMRNKWASCSTAGTLSFNDELLAMERELGVYVIVHELLHFSVPNHGKLWKSLMRAHLGDYEEMENRLRSVGS
ncbi:M48 family metallopeptidase [Alcanivorax sp.]|uniref:M48 metallopeptidase family protein n=1 Tax=Alcanivorax sp. TaxID=1872427 RepID=UPI002585FC97|nr:M48 family metallopeptidase [Alcanivorax sp.]